MSQRKKLTLWLAGGVVTFFLILLALVLLLPLFINLEPISARIQNNVSSRLGVNIKYENLHISFIPQPRVSLHSITLSVPNRFSASAESFQFSLDLPSLLKGRLQIKRIHLKSPEIQIELEDLKTKEDQRRERMSLRDFKENMAPILAFLNRDEEGMDLALEKGKLFLSKEGEILLEFLELDGHIAGQTGSLALQLIARSSLCEKISFKGNLDPRTFEGNGKLDLIHLRPHKISPHLLPTVNEYITQSEMDLRLSFMTRREGAVDADFHGSIPQLTVRRSDKELVIEQGRLKGEFHWDENGVRASLSELELAQPRLSLTGKMIFQQPSPRILIEIEGRNISIQSVKDMAGTALAQSDSLHSYLEFIEQGRISGVFATASSDSITGLGQLRNLKMEGDFVDGKILIPQGNLALEDVKATVQLSDGILLGKRIGATWGKSRAYGGKFNIDLLSEESPVSMEVQMDMDLAPVPDLVHQVVKSRSFKEAMKRVKNLKGLASGRVVISGKRSALKPRVEFSKVQITTQYEGFPMPLTIEEGGFSYAHDRLIIKNLNGKVGKSTFHNVLAHLALGGQPTLNIKSGRSSIFLDEVFPWVSSLEGLDDVGESVKSARGSIKVSSMTMKGPISKPKAWDFNISGIMDNVLVGLPMLPEQVLVQKGRFRASPDKLAFHEWDVSFLDTRMAFSGGLQAYLQDAPVLDLKFHGHTGTDTMDLIPEFVDLPPSLKEISPFSVTGAQLSWTKNGDTAFAGDFLYEGGRISFDMLHNSERLQIKKVEIQDDSSKASAGLNLQGDLFDFYYSGMIAGATVNNILEENRVLDGWIKGDIRLKGKKSELNRVRAHGNLKGKGLNLPFDLGERLKVEDISLSVDKRKLTLESAQIKWGDSRMTLAGDAIFGQKDVAVALDLFANEINGDRIEALFANESNNDKASGTWPSMSIRGKVGVHTELFRYRQFQWQPLQVLVSFGQNGVDVRVKESRLCGISTTGTLNMVKDDLSIDFQPAIKEQDLNATLTCLGYTKVEMSGTVTAKSSVIGSGQIRDLVKSLEGDVEISCTKGRINRFGLLAKVFSFLNVTPIFKGQLPNFGKGGFPYDQIKIKGKLGNNKLGLTEVILDAPSMKIVSQGELDLIDKKVNATILVAPLRTAFGFFEKIPIIKHLLREPLLAIPVKVKGDLDNPEIKMLSPTAVASQLKGIAERTIRLPFEILKPFGLYGSKEQVTTQE